VQEGGGWMHVYSPWEYSKKRLERHHNNKSNPRKTGGWVLLLSRFSCEDPSAGGEIRVGSRTLATIS